MNSNYRDTNISLINFSLVRRVTFPYHNFFEGFKTLYLDDIYFLRKSDWKCATIRFRDFIFKYSVAIMFASFV